MMRHLALSCFIGLAACASAPLPDDEPLTATLRAEQPDPRPTDGLGDILPLTCTYPAALRAINQGRDLETVITTWGQFNPPVPADINLALLLRAYEGQVSEAEESYIFNCLGVDVTLPWPE